VPCGTRFDAERRQIDGLTRRINKFQQDEADEDEADQKFVEEQLVMKRKLEALLADDQEDKDREEEQGAQRLLFFLLKNSIILIFVFKTAWKYTSQTWGRHMAGSNAERGRGQESTGPSAYSEKVQVAMKCFAEHNGLNIADVTLAQVEGGGGVHKWYDQRFDQPKPTVLDKPETETVGTPTAIASILSKLQHIYKWRDKANESRVNANSQATDTRMNRAPEADETYPGGSKLSRGSSKSVSRGSSKSVSRGRQGTGKSRLSVTNSTF